MSRLQAIREERLKKITALRELGVDPYPSQTGIFITIKEAREQMGKTVTVVGRLFAFREHGKLIFADLRDEAGRIQLMFKADLLNEQNQKLSKLLDIGDFIKVSGVVITSQRGEISVQVNEVSLLSKALRPLPEKHEGLKNTEERYRKRYLDTLANEESKKLLDARWKIVKEIRKFLWARNFTEVETPVLQNLYGGTNAKPFTTHMNALDIDLYLRVAPELYLKRLIVGGYEKIFEIARNFRNEGIDATHQPEFTMIEWYEAYTNYHGIMDTAEALTKHLVKEVHGSEELLVKGQKINIAGQWPRVPMTELIQKHLNLDTEKASDEELKAFLEKYNLQLLGAYSRGKAIFSIFDHLVTDKLITPTWVIDYPIEVCPPQKLNPAKPGFAERFEGYIGGVELCDGWSEINDGIDQRQRFEVEQQHMREGDAEAHPLDEDFIESLEYGMPPLGGIGIGIDRLVMFLTDTWTIRDVIAFPTLRPE